MAKTKLLSASIILSLMTLGCTNEEMIYQSPQKDDGISEGDSDKVVYRNALLRFYSGFKKLTIKNNRIMKHNQFMALLLSSMMIMAGACSDNNDTPTPPEPEQTPAGIDEKIDLTIVRVNDKYGIRTANFSEKDTKLLERLNTLSIKAFANQLEDTQSENVAISPLTMQNHIGLAVLTSAGETYDKLKSLFEAGDWSYNDFANFFRGLNIISNQDYSTPSPIDERIPIQWAAVNSDAKFRYGPDVKYNTNCTDNLKKIFDFISEETIPSDTWKPSTPAFTWINSAGDMKSFGVFDFTSKSTYFISDMSFHLKWQGGIKDRATSLLFQSSDGTTSETGALIYTPANNMQCGKANGLLTVTIPLYGESFKATYIMPEDKSADDAFTDKLSKGILEIPAGKSDIAEILLPKFQLNYKFDATESIRKAGFDNIFTTDADFSRLGYSVGGQSFVNFCMQTAFKCTYDGVTQDFSTKSYNRKATMNVESSDSSTAVDKPFYFVVYNSTNGVIVYLAKISKL